MPAKKIVLSDEPELLDILDNSCFHEAGFEMVLVKDGQTGFEAIEAEAPTLAVFDLNHLGDQALECCHSLKSDALLANTPIMMIAQQHDHNLVASCKNAGCDALIFRPIDQEGFIKTALELIGIEKRSAKRFSVDFNLGFYDHKQKSYSGRCLNLNIGGMFVATDSLFPVDTLLLIECALPNSYGSIDTPARVAWVNHPEWLKKDSLPSGMGLQFVQSRLVFKSILSEFIETLSN